MEKEKWEKFQRAIETATGKPEEVGSLPNEVCLLPATILKGLYGENGGECFFISTPLFLHSPRAMAEWLLSRLDDGCLVNAVYWLTVVLIGSGRDNGTSWQEEIVKICGDAYPNGPVDGFGFDKGAALRLIKECSDGDGCFLFKQE